MSAAPGPIYRLLFLDIDGTLVGKSDQVSPRVREALRRAREEADCQVVLCTGRSRHSARKVAEQIGEQGYAVVSNGAVVCEWESGRILHKIDLAAETVATAVRLAHTRGVSPFCVGVHYDEDDGRVLYTDNRYPHTGSFHERNHERFLYCDDLTADLPAAPLSMCVYGDPDSVTALAEDWRAALTDTACVFDSPSLHYAGQHTAYFFPGDAQKALSAARVADLLGIPREQTLAIGDFDNDIPLLTWAGLGVCMGDGSPSALAAADVVTGALHEDGVAQAIERYILRPTG